MIVRWISLVPPGIVHSHEPMKSSTQVPDSQPLDAGLASSVWAGEPADLGAEVRHPLQQLAVVELDDRGVGRARCARPRGRSTRLAAQRPQAGDLGLESGQPVLHQRRRRSGASAAGPGPGAGLRPAGESRRGRAAPPARAWSCRARRRASPAPPASRRSPGRRAGWPGSPRRSGRSRRSATRRWPAGSAGRRYRASACRAGSTRCRAVSARPGRCGPAAGTSRRAWRRWPTASAR